MNTIQVLRLEEHNRPAWRALQHRLPSAFGLLYDDLDDIYSDLLEGMNYYNSGDECAVQNAVWQWNLLFYVHWGRHVTRALAKLHELIAEPAPHV